MKRLNGYLVTNAFLKSEKFITLYALLKETFSHHDIDLKVVTSLDLGLNINDFFKDKVKPDFVLFYDKDIYLAERLENADIRVFNSKRAIELSDNKILMYQTLEKAGLKYPKTYCAPKTFEGLNRPDLKFLDNIEKEIGYPMVLKEAYGSFGEQVYLINSRKEMEDIIYRLNYKDFVIQEYIESSKGRDVRLNVVDDKVIVSMLRENEDDFKSNISSGGTGRLFEPTKEFKELAVKTVKAIGLDFAGVDLMFLSDGSPIICEVNSNPQFKSTLDATGVNLADYIAEYIKSQL